MKPVAKPVNAGQTRAAEAHAANAARTAPATKPATTALSRAAEMSGRTMPATGKPAGMKKGGGVDGVAKKGKTKGKEIAMKRGGKC